MFKQKNTIAFSRAMSICRSQSPDYGAARALLEKASEAGDARATYALATWYLFGGRTVRKNTKKGVEMLISIEASNIAEALFDLAIAYDWGRRVKKDLTKSFTLYMRSALLGHAEACEQVARIIAQGHVIKRDDHLVGDWMLRADEREDKISPSYRLWLEPRNMRRAKFSRMNNDARANKRTGGPTPSSASRR